MMSRLPLLLGLASLCAPVVAHADLAPPPSITSCEGAAADAPCQTDAESAGRCVPSRCSKLDYTNGVPPQSVEYDCLRCEPVPPAVQQSRCTVDSAVGLMGVLVAFAAALRRRRDSGS